MNKQKRPQQADNHTAGAPERLMWGCGLCEHRLFVCIHTHPYRPLQGRKYWQCQQCYLIQVSPEQRLSVQAEKALYDIHENDIADNGYRSFLSQLSTPLARLLQEDGKINAQGLDFGSGPAPVLAELMNSYGHRCTTYDLFYQNEPQRLQDRYDFITASEVFEHLASPAKVLDTLTACLKPGALFAIMMQRPDEQPDFATWGYLNDPTHISFYPERTLSYINAKWSLTELFRSKNVLVWRYRLPEQTSHNHN